MSKPIDERPLLAAGESWEATAMVNSETGALGVALVDGASADVDIHVDARVSQDFPDFSEDFIPAATQQAPPDYHEIDQLDLEDIDEVRVRIINNDGAESVEAVVVLNTDTT